MGYDLPVRIDRLIHLGAKTIPEIAKQTGSPQSSCYRIVKDLLTKGLIVVVYTELHNSSKTRYYRARE